MTVPRRTLLVFTIIFILLFLKEAVPRFQDPDTFYHVMITEMIRDQGIPTVFPWFSFTTWPEMYVDAHLLYHVALIPFVTFFDPLVGVKIAALLFGMLTFFTLYRVLKSIRAPYAELLTLAAALCAPFLYRISFARAISLSVTTLLIITWAALTGRKWIAFLASAFFVWLYHGYPTALLSIFAICVADWLACRLVPTHKPQFWQSIWPIGAGLLTGLIINPTFPNNIIFSVLDIFKIGVVGRLGTNVMPGSEWFGVMLGNVVESAVPIAFILLLSILSFVGACLSRHVQISHEKVRVLFTFLFLGTGYSLLTIRSNRFIEYAVPFLTLAAGAFLAIAFPYLESTIFPTIRDWFHTNRSWKKVSIGLLFITTIALGGNEVLASYKGDYYQTRQYQFASDWIKTNVPENEIIFTNIWDFGSVLVYLDPTYRVIVGLDPRFMSDPFPEKYQLLMEISSGESDKLSAITDVFQSRVVVVDMRSKEAEAFSKQLESSNTFHEVGRNEWVRLFTCLSACGLPVSHSAPAVTY